VNGIMLDAGDDISESGLKGRSKIEVVTELKLLDDILETPEAYLERAK